MRRFELVEGTSNKFWEVALSGADVTVRFGRIGTNGQTKAKTHASPEAARKDHDKLVKEKTSGGYNEVAVAAFLARRIGFLDIARIVEDVMSASAGLREPIASLQQVQAADLEARRRAEAALQGHALTN